MIALVGTKGSLSPQRFLKAYAREAPLGLGRILSRITGSWDRSDFERLMALLTAGADGAKALWHAPSVTPRLVAILAALPHALRTGKIAEKLNTRQAELVARAVRRLGPDKAGLWDMRRRLGRASSPPHLFAMLLDSSPPRARANAPSIAADWLRPLDTADALRDAGARFRNCLASHTLAMRAGAACYFEVLGREPAVVQIVRWDDLWRIGEVSGIHNRIVSEQTRERLRVHLERNGVLFTPQSIRPGGRLRGAGAIESLDIDAELAKECSELPYNWCRSKIVKIIGRFMQIEITRLPGARAGAREEIVELRAQLWADEAFEPGRRTFEAELEGLHEAAVAWVKHYCEFYEPEAAARLDRSWSWTLPELLGDDALPQDSIE